MKKLMLCFLLLLCGCSEKTQTMNYKGVEITYREKDKEITEVSFSDEAESTYGDIEFEGRNYVDVLDEMDTYYVLDGKVFHPDVIVTRSMLEDCYQRIVITMDNVNDYFEEKEIEGATCILCKEEQPLLIISPVIATYQSDDEEKKVEYLTFQQVSELIVDSEQDELVDVTGSFDIVNIPDEYFNEDSELGQYIAYEYKDSIRVVTEQGIIYKADSTSERSKYETYLNKDFTSLDDKNSNFYLYCTKEELYSED